MNAAHVKLLVDQLGYDGAERVLGHAIARPTGTAPRRQRTTGRPTGRPRMPLPATCAAGHPLSEDAVYHEKNGRRRCKLCHRAHVRKYEKHRPKRVRSATGAHEEELE